LIEGIALILLGLLFLARPVITGFVVVQILGIYFLISGIVSIVTIFTNRGHTGWKLFSGIVGIIAGLLVLAYPVWSLFLIPTTLVIVIALFGIVLGVVALLQAFQGGGWGVGILGVVMILFGLFLLFNPFAAALGLPFVLGIVGVVGGLLVVIMSFSLRSAEKKLAAAAAAAAASKAMPFVRPATTAGSSAGAAAVAAGVAAVKPAQPATGPQEIKISGVSMMDTTTGVVAADVVTQTTDMTSGTVTTEETRGVGDTQTGSMVGDDTTVVEDASGGLIAAEKTSLAVDAVAGLAAVEKITATPDATTDKVALDETSVVMDTVSGAAAVGEAHAVMDMTTGEITAAVPAVTAGEEMAEEGGGGVKLPAEMDKFNDKLEYVEGIGPVYAQKLADTGINTPLELLQAGATPKGRQEIADKTGIGSALILKWVNHTDLYRVKGVGSEFADLLEASGVDTVVELATRNPQNLYEKMVVVNDEKKLVRQTPTLPQVLDWVEQAGALPRIISY
jgi:uncharacterized membrane protein HdeD (DUF308 family)/predicted flap endonuclease-1-like 5' DNA nuclease